MLYCVFAIQSQVSFHLIIYNVEEFFFVYISSTELLMTILVDFGNVLLLQTKGDETF